MPASRRNKLNKQRKPTKMGLIDSSCKRGLNSVKSRSPTKICHLESFENACLELFASFPLVANRHGSLYPGKVQSLESYEP